jgi:hypothetical protein
MRGSKASVEAADGWLSSLERIQMTGAESRTLYAGARVCWNANKSDCGTVTEKDWAGVTIKWDSRGVQQILHNDMAAVSVMTERTK